jgi:hypothetical protein
MGPVVPVARRRQSQPKAHSTTKGHEKMAFSSGLLQVFMPLAARRHVIPEKKLQRKLTVQSDLKKFLKCCLLSAVGFVKLSLAW